MPDDRLTAGSVLSKQEDIPTQTWLALFITVRINGAEGLWYHVILIVRIRPWECLQSLNESLSPRAHLDRAVSWYVHVKDTRRLRLTEPPPRKELRVGRLGPSVGEGGVMNGESSRRSEGDEGREALGVLAEEGAKSISEAAH